MGTDLGDSGATGPADAPASLQPPAVTADSCVVDPAVVAIRASVAFPSVELLVVNDIAGVDLPLLQLDVSKTSGSYLAFHVAQRKLATFNVGVAAQYYNGASDSWETLLEYASFRVEYAAPQPLAPSLHTGAHPVPILPPELSALVTPDGAAGSAWFDPISSRHAWLALRGSQGIAASSRDPSALRLSSTGRLFALEDSLLTVGLEASDADDAGAAPSVTLQRTPVPASLSDRDREAAALRRQMLHQRYRSATFYDGIGEGEPLLVDDDEAEVEEDGDAAILTVAAADAAAQADPDGQEDEDEDDPGSARWSLPSLGPGPFAVDSSAISINLKALAREQTLLLARRRAHGNAIAGGGIAGAPIQLPPFSSDPPYRYHRDAGSSADGGGDAAPASTKAQTPFAVDLPALPADTYLRVSAVRRVNLNITPAFVNALLLGYSQFAQVGRRGVGSAWSGGARLDLCCHDACRATPRLR